jgi:hypothetical protein
MTGLIDLEYPQAGCDLGPALGESVESRAEDNVLPDAAVRLLRDKVVSHDLDAENRGSLVEFNIPIRKRFTEIRKWRPLILFVKIPLFQDSFISKNEGMSEVQLSNFL